MFQLKTPLGSLIAESKTWRGQFDSSMKLARARSRISGRSRFVRADTVPSRSWLKVPSRSRIIASITSLGRPSD